MFLKRIRDLLDESGLSKKVLIEYFNSNALTADYIPTKFDVYDRNTIFYNMQRISNKLLIQTMK